MRKCPLLLEEQVRKRTPISKLWHYHVAQHVYAIVTMKVPSNKIDLRTPLMESEPRIVTPCLFN